MDICIGIYLQVVANFCKILAANSVKRDVLWEEGKDHSKQVYFHAEYLWPYFFMKNYEMWLLMVPIFVESIFDRVPLDFLECRLPFTPVC